METIIGSNKNKGYQQTRMGKRELYTIFSAAVSVSLFAVLCITLGFGTAVRFGILLAFIPVFIYLQMKEKQFKCNPERIMNEAPSVIGMMSVVLSSNGSFDSAVRYVAENGPKNLSSVFRKVITDADCRSVPDIKESLLRTVSSFPKELSSFRRAMHIVVTAFESDNVTERMSMMKDAENIVIEGLKIIGNTYSSKLSSPCMIVFGLGIMVPMILISILPMLSMGGQFAVSSISPEVCEFLILVVIPAVVGVVIFSLKGKNPFFESDDIKSDLKYALPLLSCLPLYFILEKMGYDQDKTFIISLTAACMLTLFIMAPMLIQERKRSRTEEMLKDTLFELGNRLSMRENFDIAVIRSLETRSDCIWVSECLSREIALCRGDMEAAINEVIGKVSETVAGFYCDIYRASQRDIRDAGRLATNIAHQLQDQNAAKKDIENKLRSMLDMMTGTAAVFAPLILGMSVVMLGPISQMTGTVFFDNITQTLMIYLVELSALIAVLSSNLMCKGRPVNILSRFCISVPVALIIFTVCTTVSI